MDASGLVHTVELEQGFGLLLEAALDVYLEGSEELVASDRARFECVELGEHELGH